jgi:hypothetical protein
MSAGGATGQTVTGQHGCEPNADTPVVAAGSASSVRPATTMFNLRQQKGMKLSSDEEQRALLAAGGPFISEVSTIDNVDCSTIHIPAMAPGEHKSIIQIKAGRHEKTKTMLQANIKLVAQLHETGRRDVEGVECWHDENGRTYPQCTSVTVGPLFCDNITALSGVKNGYDLRHLCELFDLSHRDQVKNSEADLLRAGAGERPAQRYSMRQVGGNSSRLKTRGIVMNEATKLFEESEVKLWKYKFSLTSVKLRTVGDILAILKHAASLPCEILNDEALLLAASEDFRRDHWQQHYHPGHLAAALKRAATIRFCDIDLTNDVGGTLNTAELEKALDVVQHQCGRNMIRMAPYTMPLRSGAVVSCSAKYYNKPAETLSQGEARGRDVACKFEYLLNPSQPGLKTFMREHHHIGVSRYETTFSCPFGNIPPLEELILLHEAKNELRRVPAVLVQCSIHEHIRLFERAITGSVAVIFPSIGRLKRSGLAAGKMVKKEANAQAEGAIVHYYNSMTRKFIGNTVRGQHGRNGGETESGLQRLMQNVAWGSLCGHPTHIYVCIGEPGQGLSDKLKVTRNYYFRVFVASPVYTGPETPGPLPTRTMWVCGPQGDFAGRYGRQHHETDMHQIGVDIGQLTNLRLGIINKGTQPSFENMGFWNIDLVPKFTLDGAETAAAAAVVTAAPAPALELWPDDTSSEGRRGIAGIREQYHPISALSATAEHPARVQGCWRVDDQCRRKTTGKTLILKSGGDNYKVPSYAETADGQSLWAQLLQYEVEGKRPELFIWNQDDQLRWGIYDNGAPTSSPDACYAMENARISKTALIPTNEWIPILKFDRKMHSKGKTEQFIVTLPSQSTVTGRYYLPETAKKFVQSVLETKKLQWPSDLHALHGWEVMHLGGSPIRTRPVSNNPEQPFVLKNSTDGELFRNHDTLSLKRPGDEAPAPAAKRARHT